MMDEIKRLKSLAEEAALEAGRFILGRMGKVREVFRKEGQNNLVTDVDKASEKMIIAKVRKNFPSHSILAEEGGSYSSEGGFKWIIDPLDGTTNYTHAFPIFCVSIAVTLKDSVRIGVVYDPSRDELFTAEEGGGAFLNGKRIKVSETVRTADSLVATGFAYGSEGKNANIGYFKKIMNRVQAIRRAGSAAIDLCYVACGRFDGFWELDLAPWDMAAGQLIVKEAGGTVTMLGRRAFDVYGKEIVATNGKIHGEMLDLLKK
ncbi:MAG: inositol monophosphatase family protein [Candidatus Omnitrophota bacterium]